MKKKMLAILVGLLVISMVSAGIVNYLSNKAKATVDVNSPMSAKMSNDGSIWLDEIDMEAIYGGEPTTVYVKMTNLASVDTTGIVENKVNNSGITCEDFTSVIATTITTFTAANPPSDQKSAELEADPNCNSLSGESWKC